MLLKIHLEDHVCERENYVLSSFFLTAHLKIRRKLREETWHWLRWMIMAYFSIKCGATRANSRVTHGSSRFRKYACAARPVSANKQSCSQSAESCKSVGAIHQEVQRRQVPFRASEINNDKMRIKLQFSEPQVYVLYNALVYASIKIYLADIYKDYYARIFIK